MVADNVDGEYIMAQHRHNSRFKGRPDLPVGDLVWLTNQRPKIHIYHHIQGGEIRVVHVAQLKPFFDDVLVGGVQLHHYR